MNSHEKKWVIVEKEDELSKKSAAPVASIRPLACNDRVKMSKNVHLRHCAFRDIIDTCAYFHTYTRPVVFSQSTVSSERQELERQRCHLYICASTVYVTTRFLRSFQNIRWFVKVQNMFRLSETVFL